MLKYLIIPLAKDAVSFCHYETTRQGGYLIPLNILRDAIIWGVKRNLNIQFIYPDRELPKEYKTIIDSIDHIDIVGSKCEDFILADTADIVVFDEWEDFFSFSYRPKVCYVLRTCHEGFFANICTIIGVLPKIKRLIIVFTDIIKFSEADFTHYEKALNDLIPAISNEYVHGNQIYLNLLSDRLQLEKMNNCNAGCESITLAPDGKFYICPAFFYDKSADGHEESRHELCSKSYSVGSLEKGLNINNPQPYRLDHAPICRCCDAFQCRRCIWLNRRTTSEVNTPSHEQCVIAHIERNASKKLLDTIRGKMEFIPQKSIEATDYIDPFEIINKS